MFTFPHKPDCRSITHPLPEPLDRSGGKEIGVYMCEEIIQVQNLYIDEEGNASVDSRRFEKDDTVKKWLECPDCFVKVEDVSNVEVL